MNSVKIDRTESSLAVTLDADKHYLEFAGESRPENVKAFFLPIIDWVNNYSEELGEQPKENQPAVIKAVFKLEYFNSSSAKCIVDIILAINTIKVKLPNTAITIEWQYPNDDDDLLDSGEEIVRFTGVSMEFVKI